MTEAIVYDISLRIEYSYSPPAGAHRTLLRMWPRTQIGQSVLDGALSTTPEPDFRRDSRDFFGNPMTEMTHGDPLSQVTFRFDGRVQRTLPETTLDFSCALSDLPRELLHHQSLAPDSPHHFTNPSPRVELLPDIADFARAAAAGSRSVHDAVFALSHAIHTEFTFDPTATDVATDPAEAFEARSGVCQDYSHVMISGLRSLGIPAGYVSGFLRTLPPEGQERLEGADAMHAWVRAWCGAKTGWLEIDPTNDAWTGGDHITVALGRDYGDVAPVVGSLRSAGQHATSHSVDVVPV